MSAPTAIFGVRKRPFDEHLDSVCDTKEWCATQTDPLYLPGRRWKTFFEKVRLIDQSEEQSALLKARNNKRVDCMTMPMLFW